MKRKLDHEASVKFAVERLKQLHVKEDAIFGSTSPVPFFSLADFEAMTTAELQTLAIELGFFHEVNFSIARALENGQTLPDTARQWAIRFLRCEVEAPTNPEGRPLSNASLDVVIKMIVDELQEFGVRVYGSNDPKTDQSKGALCAISEATENLKNQMEVLTREQVKSRYLKHLKWLNR